MVAFYKAFLGAEAAYENEFLSFLTYDEEHHRLAIAYIPGTLDKIRTSAGLEHIAFTYDTLDDLILSYKQRKARNIEPIWCVNHGPTTSMYYQDPDGNQLEIQIDNFATSQEATDFMMSAEYAENPIGTDFDVEELIRRVEAGEDSAQIKKRPHNGPRGMESVPEPPHPIIKESYEPIAVA